MSEQQWDYDDDWPLEWDDDALPAVTYAKAISSLREAGSARNDVAIEWGGGRSRRGDARVVFLGRGGASSVRVRFRHVSWLSPMIRVIESAELMPDRRALWYRDRGEILAWLRSDYDQTIAALGHRLTGDRRQRRHIDGATAADVMGSLAYQGALAVEADGESATRRRICLTAVPEDLKLIFGAGRQDISGVALRMSNFLAADVEEAAKTLDQYASGYLYNAMRCLRTSLRLWAPSYPTAPRSVSPRHEKMRFPRCAYDPTAFELYAAATVEERDNLERYLKYYQVLEYFYPRAVDKYTAEHGITKRSQRLPSGPALSSERGALEVVVRYALNSVQLNGFVKGSRILPPLSDATIINGVEVLPIGPHGEFDLSVDYLALAASRIYGIRCRIVHAKEPVPGARFLETPLLPYTREARDLRADLELVRFVAERALDYWSTSFA